MQLQVVQPPVNHMESFVSRVGLCALKVKDEEGMR